MKTPFLTVLAAGLLLGADGARADEQADAKALLDKAMKAMGGEAKLAKLSTASVKGKLTGSPGGQEITIDVDGTWQGMSQYRADADVQEGGQSFKGILVFNGTKGWLKKNCRTEEAPEGITTFVQNIFHAGRIPQLLPALTDKAYKLSHLGEIQIGDKAAVGLAISHKDRKDVSLFFDKATGLPAKSELRVTDPQGKEVTAAFNYSDYKDFDGVKLCSRIKIKIDEIEVTMELKEIKPLDKVDDSLFDKP
jgi:hypothetical protein